MSRRRPPDQATNSPEPQSDVDAERAVLGAVLLDNNAMWDLPSSLSADRFHFTSHKVTFAAMHSMLAEGRPVDLVTLVAELKKRGDLENAGGASYVASLTNAVPSTANAADYARIVGEKDTRRRLIFAHHEAAKLANDPTLEVPEIQKRIDELLIGVEVGGGAVVRSEREIARAMWKRVQESLDNPDASQVSERAFKTGLACIDRVLRVGRQDLFVVAADSGGGKSIFMQQVARNVGMGEGARNVLVAPLEMAGEQMVQRRIMDVGELYLDDVYRPRSQGAIAKWQKAVAKIDRESKVHYVEKTWDLPTILREASRIARRCKCPKRPFTHLPTCEGLALLVVDYLQILDFSREWGERRDEQIGSATRMLKRWTGLHDVPVMFASQLRRRDDDKIPRLSDLRESGNLGNDATAVGIIYRPCEIRGTEEYKRRSESDLRSVTFLLEKQRQGQSQVEIPLVHHFEFSRFRDPIEVDAAEPAQAGMGFDGEAKPDPKSRGAHA